MTSLKSLAIRGILPSLLLLTAATLRAQNTSNANY